MVEMLSDIKTKWLVCQSAPEAIYLDHQLKFLQANNFDTKANTYRVIGHSGLLHLHGESYDCSTVRVLILKDIRK